MYVADTTGTVEVPITPISLPFGTVVDAVALITITDPVSIDVTIERNYNVAITGPTNPDPEEGTAAHSLADASNVAFSSFGEGSLFTDMQIGDRITYLGSYTWSVVANNTTGPGLFEITPPFVGPDGLTDFLFQQITPEIVHYGAAEFGFSGQDPAQGILTVDNGTPVIGFTAYPIELLQQAIQVSSDWRILTAPTVSRPSTFPLSLIHI